MGHIPTTSSNPSSTTSSRTINTTTFTAPDGTATMATTAITPLFPWSPTNSRICATPSTTITTMAGVASTPPRLRCCIHSDFSTRTAAPTGGMRLAQTTGSTLPSKMVPGIRCHGSHWYSHLLISTQDSGTAVLDSTMHLQHHFVIHFVGELHSDCQQCYRQSEADSLL